MDDVRYENFSDEEIETLIETLNEIRQQRAIKKKLGGLLMPSTWSKDIVANEPITYERVRTCRHGMYNALKNKGLSDFYISEVFKSLSDRDFIALYGILGYKILNRILTWIVDDYQS